MAYTIRFERDEDGWWVATAKEVPGCHTQGRSLRQARNRIREALGLFVDDAETAELVPDIKLPTEVRQIIQEQKSARKDVEQRQKKAQQATARAARVLTSKIGMSVRDAAELLGLSHQRIQQLVAK